MREQGSGSISSHRVAIDCTVDYLITNGVALHKCYTAWNFRQPELGQAGARGIWLKCAYYIPNTPKLQICSIKWAFALPI